MRIGSLLTLFIAGLILLTSPLAGHATQINWNYQVTGETPYPGYQDPLPVTGNLIISPMYGGPWPTKEDQDVWTSRHFTIQEANLEVGPYLYKTAFSDAGHIALDICWNMECPYGSFGPEKTTYWSINVQETENQDFIFFGFNAAYDVDFFDEDYREFSIYDYENLAPVIRFFGAVEFWDSSRTQFTHMTYTDLWATNPSPAPVPEPSTLLLAGAGLLVLAYRRTRKKH